jgi:hypothetical protein
LEHYTALVAKEFSLLHFEVLYLAKVSFKGINMTINKIILAGLFCLATLTTQADVLLIDVISKEPANDATGLLRPTNGRTMDQVKARFGEPVKVYPAVGKPPITRWNYPQFSVYFEHNLVIHSVVNKPKKSTP